MELRLFPIFGYGAFLGCPFAAKICSTCSASPEAEIIAVPAYTHLKLHDITSGPGNLNEEPIDVNWPSWSPGFRKENRRFLTRRLWGVKSQPSYLYLPSW